jgi:hypothetical protein
MCISPVQEDIYVLFVSRREPFCDEKKIYPANPAQKGENGIFPYLDNGMIFAISQKRSP